jgi:hypothetical protein
MVAIKPETMYLKSSQRLAGVSKEWHTRKKDGKAIAYVILDRCGKIALLTQKLPAVSEFINTHLVDPDEPWARVNTVGMWEILNQTGGRVGGFHKGRWRVMSVDLEQATTAFEAARRVHEEAAVIGVPSCYDVCA